MVAAGPRDPADKVVSRTEAVRRTGPGRSFRLVFTNGVFDLMHPGHVHCLRRARELGDVLLVAINSDASARRLGKGPGRPLVGEQGRAEVVAALECVDLVTVFDEDTPRELVAALQPDVLVKGGDYSEDEVAGAGTVRARGGEVVIVPLLPGHSTSRLVEGMGGGGGGRAAPGGGRAGRGGGGDGPDGGRAGRGDGGDSPDAGEGRSARGTEP